MAMQTSPGRAPAQMNVTPLIDVLLVLLIIFMVITPLTPRGEPALVPQSPDAPAPPSTAETPVVLQVAANGALALNSEKLTRREDLPERLRKIFQFRSRRVLFVHADPATPFESVALVIGEAKLFAQVGLLPRPPENR